MSQTSIKTKLSFKQIYLLSNHRATNWQRVDRLHKVIVKAFRPAKHVELDVFEGKSEPNKELRQVIANWDKDTLVCIGGGDGTVSFVANELLRVAQEHSASLQAVLLPLWGGNANDLAIMLNGLIVTGSIKDVCIESEPVNVHPLFVSLELPGESQTIRYAMSYASFGVTAHATWAMEGSSHDRESTKLSWPGVRFVAEVRDVLGAVVQAPSFDIEHDDGREEVYERIFSNGSRVAKLNGLPVALNEQKYFEAISDKKHIHFVWYSIKSFWRNHGTVRSEPTSFTIHHTTKAQIDGEVIDVLPGTRVTVGVHSEAVRMLSRRLKVKRS